MINGLIDPIFGENLLLFGRVGVESAAEVNLFLMLIDGVAWPPEVQLQRFLGELPAGAWLIARFVSPSRVNELVSVRQSLHIDNKIIDFRIDIGPGRDAPHAVISLVVTLGDRRFANGERRVKHLFWPSGKLASLN